MTAGAERVRLLAMGGTIAVKASPDGALHALGADDLAALVPDAAVAIETVDFSQGSSIALDGAQLVRLAHAVGEGLASGVGGLVITHGTDTLIETAKFIKEWVNIFMSANFELLSRFRIFGEISNF